MALFARLRFMVRFARHYRAARKKGVSHEDALASVQEKLIDAEFGDGAWGQMSGDTALELPETVRAQLENPTSYFYDQHQDDENANFPPDTVAITAEHIALLRLAHFAWDGAERGAPMLDPDAPFGKTDVLEQIGEIFGVSNPEAQVQHFVDTTFTLNRLLEHGTIEAGIYAPANISPEHIRNQLAGYGESGTLSDTEMGFTPAGGFILTEELITLVRNINVEWSNTYDNEDRIASGQWPAPTCDPKRPYGDMTYIEVDMARILDLAPSPIAAGIETDDAPPFKPSAELADRLQRLHWQMLGAMQVFVENAELAPGTYR